MLSVAPSTVPAWLLWSCSANLVICRDVWSQCHPAPVSIALLLVIMPSAIMSSAILFSASPCSPVCPMQILVYHVSSSMPTLSLLCSNSSTSRYTVLSQSSSIKVSMLRLWSDPVFSPSVLLKAANQCTVLMYVPLTRFAICVTKFSGILTMCGITQFAIWSRHIPLHYYVSTESILWLMDAKTREPKVWSSLLIKICWAIAMLLERTGPHRQQICTFAHTGQ